MGHEDASCGRYQASASVMMALLKMPAAWFQLSMLFLSPNINFRCAKPFQKSDLLSNQSEDSISKLWDDSCKYQNEGGTEHTCDFWEYDRQEFTHTVNMMWNLVCDQEMVVTWAQVSFMSGVFSGNAIGGFLADRVGRKPVLVVSVLLQPFFSAIVAVVPLFSLFLVFRFLLGLVLGGTMVISFVLGGELVNSQWRPAISILNQVPFGMGQTLLAATAYFLRDWRDIQMALSAYCLIFLPYCWMVEESPKWLVATGRHKQADKVMAVIHQKNGLAPAANTEMHPIAGNHNVEIVKTENNKVKKSNEVGSQGKVGFCDLFRTSRLRHYTFAVWLMWYCAGLSFFAMNAYQIQLGGSSMVNVGVGGLIGGIPGNILTVYLVRRFSKKKIIIIAHILVSVSAILIPVYDVGEAPMDWQRRLLGLSTLVAMSVAFPALFLHCGQVLPIVVRGSVMFVANLMARLGNTTAPLVGTTAGYHKWMPLCIIAAAPLITVAVMLTLPDTADRPIPQTFRDSKGEPDPVTVTVSMEEGSKIYRPVAQNDS